MKYAQKVAEINDQAAQIAWTILGIFAILSIAAWVIGIVQESRKVQA